MSSTEIIHSRLYKVDGVCYADEDVISEAEFAELRDHYYTLVDKLAAPWQNRNDNYDSTGRFNTGGMSEYEERI